MPDLDGAGEGQYAEQHIGYDLQRDRRDEQFLAIEGIGNRAGKQAEKNKRQGFQKSGEPELKGGTGDIVNLVKRGDVANLAGERA